jgi:hypothetical protein
MKEQGEGGEREIDMCLADERENPRVREHLDMSAFGLVTGEVLCALKHVVQG